ncbi:collagen alpha-1(XXIII) chain-like [Solea solea]|uniref:collagen alpha-1(XXIII) chain-like n=1 Tax=Solea solea TaxID=90069 RepID=UPI00272BC57E|nr:collagen alpha-1(XXIII) chain-like [Solea solea]
MERDQDQKRTVRSHKLRQNWTWICRDLSCVALCVALSVLCLGVCVVVLVRASELQSRVESLEQQQRDARVSSAWSVSLEQVEPVLLSRLDQILDEKLAARLPKTREVREAPHSCLCPPEPDMFVSGAVKNGL